MGLVAITIVIVTAVAPTTVAAAAVVATSTVATSCSSVESTALHAAAITVSISTAAISTLVHSTVIFLKLRQFSCACKFEVTLAFRLLVLKDIFEPLRVVSWYIEAGTGHVTEGTHHSYLPRDLLGHVLANEVPDHRYGVEWALKHHLEGNHVRLCVQKTTILEHGFVVAGKECECLHKSAFGVALLLLNQLVGSLIEDGDDFILNFLKLLLSVAERGANNVIWEWRANFFKLDASLAFDHLKEHLLLKSVESDALAAAAGSSRTAGTMDVSLGVLGWLNLHDQVDTRDVKATSSDISCHQHAEFFLLEALEGDLSLILCNIAMHDLDVFFDLL